MHYPRDKGAAGVIPGYPKRQDAETRVLQKRIAQALFRSHGGLFVLSRASAVWPRSGPIRDSQHPGEYRGTRAPERDTSTTLTYRLPGREYSFVILRVSLFALFAFAISRSNRCHGTDASASLPCTSGEPFLRHAPCILAAYHTRLAAFGSLQPRVSFTQPSRGYHLLVCPWGLVVPTIRSAASTHAIALTTPPLAQYNKPNEANSGLDATSGRCRRDTKRGKR